MGADLVEFAAEFGEVVQNCFKSTADSVGRLTMRKQLGSGARQRKTIQQKQPNKVVGYVERF